MAALATGHAVDTGVGNVAWGGRLFSKHFITGFFYLFKYLYKSHLSEVVYLTLSFFKTNFAPLKVLLGTLPSESQLSPAPPPQDLPA